MMRIIAAATRVLALVTVACSDGGEPIELRLSYDLRTVEGAAPPRLVAATANCDISVEGGRASFGPTEQFELGLDVLTDCSRGGSSSSRATYGYTGTADMSSRLVVFHTATGLGPVTFEGVFADNGNLEVSVPGLVPIVDEVVVEFAPS
jgi:hypothetical protein